MGARKLSGEHFDLIAQLGDRGKSNDYIAAALKQRFGVTISAAAISWHCLRLGAEPERRTKVTPPPTEPTSYGRNGYTVRRFTAADDAELLALEAQGLSDTEIGRAIGRRPNSVRGRLLTLARHEARAERAAKHDRQDEAA